MGRFPSGQRGQTVNLLQIASVVRIHLCPFCTLQWERAQECVTSILEACLQSACYAFLHRRIRRERENEVFECHAIRKYSVRRCGGIGRRKGLKIPRWQHRAGSSPATCSKENYGKNIVVLFFCNYTLTTIYASDILQT